MSNTHQDNANLNFTLEEQTQRQKGKVKWFNNKSGYGFATNKLGDVFMHHSNINTQNKHYKYLVEGEYIEFDLSPCNTNNYSWQATNITGIDGGKLMCETRQERKSTRMHHSSEQSTK